MDDTFTSTLTEFVAYLQQYGVLLFVLIRYHVDLERKHVCRLMVGRRFLFLALLL